MKRSMFLTQYTCHFSLFYIHFMFLYSGLLVVCLCFRYFPSRSWYKRKRSKNDQKWRRNIENAPMATSTALAMMWHPWGVTHLKEKARKLKYEVRGVRNKGMEFAMTPSINHVHHLRFMVFAMGFVSKKTIIDLLSLLPLHHNFLNFSHTILTDF